MIELDEEEKKCIERRRVVLPQGASLKLFAYGSLMWRPGFPYNKASSAKIRGYHRSFCVVSTHYRGSPDQPGLVLGLDRGGSCSGVFYEVAAKDSPAALEYLHEREMVTGIYEPRWVKTITHEGNIETALTYVVDRTHRQYAGKLSPQDVIDHIAKAIGIAGANKEYLINTLAHLRDLQLRDPKLEQLAKMLAQIS